MTKFDKLAQEIKYKVNDDFKEVQLKAAKLNDERIFELYFLNQQIIKPSSMMEFLDCLNGNFKYKAKFEFEIVHAVYEKRDIYGYLDLIFRKFIGNPQLIHFLDAESIKISGNEVEIAISSEQMFIKASNQKDLINKAMRKFGYKNFEITIVQGEESDILEVEKQKLQEKINTSDYRSADNGAKKQQEERKYSYGFQYVEISDLPTCEVNKVATRGEVFSVEHKTTKTDLLITVIAITDYKDAIKIKIFSRTEKQKEDAQNYKPGMFIEVSGNLQLDAYSNELTINVNKIVVSSGAKIKRSDNETNKRIELSARTKMSTMDGILTPKELIQRAKEWGHKAIAIVDQDSVQAFPDFYHASKGSGVKPIYGASVNTISKSSGAINQPIMTQSIIDDSYVIFDLETTGLSPEYDEIIEFGATKIVDGKIVDSIQFFVKPEKPIPAIITEITNIKDEDVANAKSEKEAIADILKYVQGFATVAHNANFDITFLNTKLLKYGYQKLTDPWIDSMVVARITQPKSKRFRLETVASRYSVEYNSNVAHRADYDADVLARVWIKMLKDLKELNINTQGDLYEYGTSALDAKKFTKEVTILAKNQSGLKELFSYISSDLTDDFNGKPSIYFEDLSKRKDVLLGTGTLNSILVDRMLYGSKYQVKEEIAKYDYVEVQPLRNFAHFVNRGFDINHIKDMIKFVIEEAKRQDKIVVATGDVKYLDEADKIYHQVYIYAKGLGGVRHPLFKFKEKNPVYPTLSYLTTLEMKEEFSFLEDVNLIDEIVVKNTHKISMLIDSDIQVIKDELYTPEFGDSDNDLKNLVYANAHKIYGEKLPQIVEDRIKRELEPIIKYGFAVIYWMSHLLVSKSLKDGYLVGSRGSVGSSIVATFAEITEVNPLQPHYVCPKCTHSEWPKEALKLNSGYDLEPKDCVKCGTAYNREGQNIPFETFLGFNADKVPDIDLNFSGVYQPTIHNEVKRLFGEKHAFRAGTISTVAEKTAYGYVKNYFEENGVEKSSAFVDFVSKKVVGTKRTTGQHPGGIIIIPQKYDVEDFCPINFPANDPNSSWKTTHFDFHAIHDNVLKLDLLGHDDPTAIKYLEKLSGVNAKEDIPFSDPKIISLFSSPEALGIKPEDIGGETTGVMGIPEFGTKFVRGMLKKATVQSFGDLISISGLSHGTDVWANNAETLIKEKNLTLNDVISCRDNIMTDLMNMNLDPSKAFTIMEKVRKGKGLTPDEEQLLREHDVEEWYIESLKKIKYMFPKAHATAYVMMAWRIAWFKLYKPLAYYATYFTTRSDVFDVETILAGRSVIEETLKDFNARRFKYGSEKLSNKEVSLIPIYEIALEAMARGITISNIDLKKSQANDWIIDEETKTIYPPFTVVDGLGVNVAETIIQAREEMDFKSKEDVSKRTSINKTSLAKLEDLGVLDHLEDTNQLSFDLF